MLLKLALEPEWEAKFEPNSYGFRPGRSCQDAIDAMYISINQKPKYVLDADIEKCFDRINHTALLDKLQTFPFLRQVIKGWLKAGVIENGVWFPTKEGNRAKAVKASVNLAGPGVCFRVVVVSAEYTSSRCIDQAQEQPMFL